MKTPLLSICIATYNRGQFIGETLDSIVPQLDDDVELLVVDGASTDNTKDVVKRYVDHDPRVRYVRLPAKGGVDQDYSKAVEFACGDFCWLFTDDDLLKQGAVDAVKRAINEGYGLIIVNAEIRDRELNSILLHQRIVIRDNKTYAPNDTEYLFVDTLLSIAFIGAVVIRRSTWLSRERDLYFGTEFVHIGVIFQKPLMEAALIIAEPYICIRHGNAQWTPRSFEIWMFKFPKLVWSFEHISDQAKQCIARKEPWRRLKTLIYLAGRGDYTLHHYEKYFSALPGVKLWKFFAWMISQMPAKILGRLIYYYCRITKPEPILLFDLKQFITK
jgi:glycosyltransferase involved in cell wall biosynthesis